MHRRSPAAGPTRPARRPRRGFTLVEMVVSMTILLAVMAIAASLFSRQASAVAGQAGRLDALQNARFALTTIERELRMAGAGTVDAQPILVLASPTALAFNVNLVSADTTDLYAVYRNPDADLAATGVFRVAERLELPGTTDLYPDTTYQAATGVPSAAETVTFWLERDPQGASADEHILYRRVNATAPEVVARGILVAPFDTVFHYMRLTGQGTLAGISQAVQPMLHTAPTHGSTADTARFGGLIDSVRAVRVRFRAAFTDTQGRRTVRSVESFIRVMNAGLSRRTTCGEQPLGVPAGAVVTTDANGVRVVRVTWGRSLDEGAGERDVERYAIYRRAAAAAEYGEPLASVPAGQPTYQFIDTQVRSGESWVYGVAALDCTPRSSSVGITPAVVIP